MLCLILQICNIFKSVLELFSSPESLAHGELF